MQCAWEYVCAMVKEKNPMFENLCKHKIVMVLESHDAASLQLCLKCCTTRNEMTLHICLMTELLSLTVMQAQ